MKLFNLLYIMFDLFAAGPIWNPPFETNEADKPKFSGK